MLTASQRAKLLVEVERKYETSFQQEQILKRLFRESLDDDMVVRAWRYLGQSLSMQGATYIYGLFLDFPVDEWVYEASERIRMLTSQENGPGDPDKRGQRDAAIFIIGAVNQEYGCATNVLQ